MEAETTTSKSLALVNKEITSELADPHIVKALLATTFKDFTPELMRQAIFEGVIRGFTFKNFLQKDVFAIKYGGGYNLVTSIDLARKIGMRSGVIGKSAPTFEMEGKQIVSCSITIKRRVGQDIGEFTATVYFNEFSTSKNLWNSKPRVMLAKVAEMHALRMACPEQLAKAYTEEEFDKTREEGGDFDNSQIADDATVTSTGDDTPGVGGGDFGHSRVQPVIPQDPITQEIPVDEDGQLKMLMAKAQRKWPEMRPAELQEQVKDFCGIPLKPANYRTVITMLS
jgi:hypothetical protein